MPRFWRLVSLPLFIASLLGCDAERAAIHDGRLDVVVRPDNAGASGRPLQGRFVLRDATGGFVDRLEVTTPYQTSSVTLPEGSYLLEWQPALSFESADQVAAALAERSLGAIPLAIVAGRVTTVNARATLVPRRETEPAAPAEELPSVEILVARR